MASDEWRDRLRKVVSESRLKQKAIARQAGIDPTTLSRILCSHLHPRFGTVVRLARVLGVSVGWLLGEQAYHLSEQERRDLRRSIDAMHAMLRNR